jgi:hypothetical protein
VAAGVPASMVATTSPIYLPYDRATDTTALQWDYWGPNGFNIVEDDRLPYRLSYTVEDHDISFWLVTVMAAPVDNPNVPVDTGLPEVNATNNPRRFRGLGSKMKIVTYSAQFPK